MKQMTRTFNAQGSDGRRYTVCEFTDFVGVRSLGDDSGEMVTASKVLRTSAGLDVVRIDEGVYQIVVTGVVLRSGDPKAT